MKASQTIGDVTFEDWRVCSDDFKTHAGNLFQAASDLCDAIEGRDAREMDPRAEDEAEDLCIKAWELAGQIELFLKRTDPDRDYEYDAATVRECDEHRLTAKQLGISRVAL